jgi:hypothetical protein
MTPSVNIVGMQQWLEVNKDLRIFAYIPSDRPQSSTELLTSTDVTRLSTTAEEDPFFGSNLREAARIIREWWSEPHGTAS